MQENIFTPEFIPYYIKEIQEHKLTPTEWLLYWFIRFYNSLQNQDYRDWETSHTYKPSTVLQKRTKK